METLRKRIANGIRYAFLRADYILWSLGKHKQLPSIIRNILVVEMKYLGDVIAITPALRALKQKYPQANITVWTFSESMPILEGNPDVSKVISWFDGDKYDMLVVFHAETFVEAAMISRATRNIPFKIGVTNAGILSSNFPGLDRKVRYGRKPKHIVEENLDVVRLIGADTKDKSYYLKHKRTNSKYPIVILSPGSKKVTEAKNPSHMWPIERWAAVADYLADKYDACVMITGTKAESQLAAKIINQMCYSAINTCGRLSIQDLIQEISGVNLLISVDSGPVHIAAAVGTPVIDLMGPQDPEIWGPWTKNAITLYHDEVCTKCKRIECAREYPECMHAITVDEVEQAIDKILKSKVI